MAEDTNPAPTVANNTAQNNADTPLVNNKVAVGDDAAATQPQTAPQSIDQLVQTQNPNPLPRVDIDQPVPQGHDMVVNHVDGSQELAQGHVAAAIHTQEAQTGEVVAKSDVDAGEAQEAPRTPDPETNGPDQQVEGKTADEVVAANQPDVNPNEPTPAFPTPAEGEAPVEPAADGEESASADAQDKAEPSSADVEGV